MKKLFFSTQTEAAAVADGNTTLPSNKQLQNHFIRCAVPMVGFGLMDQTVMLQAGNAIDCTIGVTFGLSTLAAAAFGQVCSDASGVLFGGTLESVGRMFGLPTAVLTVAQRELPVVKRIGLAGQLCGIIFGCLLGLGNLLLIDTERSSTLKLQALSEEQEFAFEVEASNALREDATVLTVRGPDIDGLLASMTAALTAKGCSLIELHATKQAAVIPPQPIQAVQTSKADDSPEGKVGITIADNGGKREISLGTTVGSASTPASNVSTSIIDITNGNNIEDLFVVTKNGNQVDDDELDDLANGLLEATSHPINVRSFTAHVQQLEEHNEQLKNRIYKLEKVLQERQIKVVPKEQVMATSTSHKKEASE